MSYSFQFVNNLSIWTVQVVEMGEFYFSLTVTWRNTEKVRALPTGNRIFRLLVRMIINWAVGESRDRATKVALKSEYYGFATVAILKRLPKYQVIINLANEPKNKSSSFSQVQDSNPSSLFSIAQFPWQLRHSFAPKLKAKRLRERTAHTHARLCHTPGEVIDWYLALPSGSSDLRRSLYLATIITAMK